MREPDLVIDLAGWLRVRSDGEYEDALYLDGRKIDVEDDESKPLAKRLERISEKFVIVRYWICERETSKDQAVTEVLMTLDGATDIQYTPHYSEPTGYLWTDEELKVGGHDLMEIFKFHQNSWLILEIAVFNEKPHDVVTPKGREPVAPAKATGYSGKMDRDHVIKACREIYDQLESDMRLTGTTPRRDPKGQGFAHLLWMVKEVLSGVMPENKCLHYYGYIQAMMVYERHSTLERENQRNRDVIYERSK